MDDRKEYIALLAEEYRTLATSGNQMDRHTYTALQWGTATVGIVVGAAISQWGKSDAAVELSFLTAIPALIALGMLYWIGELARMRRIYDFISVVEAKAELALLHTGPTGEGGGWAASFNAEWISSHDGLLSELELAMPAAGQGQIDVKSGPITYERWLRAVRNDRAPGNLTWVFMVRFLVFPLAIAAIWSAGIYYVLSQSVQQNFSWGSLLAALTGALSGLVSIWLAIELVTDMNRSSSTRPSKLSRPRKTFRRLLGGPLQITEWQASSVFERQP
jgi:hypothetical protein